MGNWSKLKADEKVRVIKFARQNGVSDIKTIRDTYNLYSSGGQEEILNKVNSSNANFVQRLKDPNRKNIPDWESPTDRISTHKLSVGTDENGNHYIFPEVQEINGELIDFTRPPYHRFAGEISAEMRGDTVRVPSIEDAIKFTETYKQYYPALNKKSTGGPLYPFSFEKNPFFKTPVVRYDEGGKTYTVKSGDYLGKIAQANGITIADILAVNPGLNADKINIGQVLNLPGKPNITRQQLGDYIKTYKNEGWTEKDIDYLYSKLSTTDWDPSAIVYAMATESSFNPVGKNPVTSAKGLAQITDATMRSIYGTQAGDSINNLYTQKKVSTQDAINHAFDFYNYAAKKVTSERDDMGYGRLKTNLLAPNAGRDSKVSKAVKANSLTEEQKGWVNLDKTTYRDLAQKYDSVFNTDFYQPFVLMKK